MAASLSIRRLVIVVAPAWRPWMGEPAASDSANYKGRVECFKLSIIIISVFIKEPYTLEKALFECVYGAGRAMEIHL